MLGPAVVGIGLVCENDQLFKVSPELLTKQGSASGQLLLLFSLLPVIRYVTVIVRKRDFSYT
jgi:hypothetical protein